MRSTNCYEWMNLYLIIRQVWPSDPFPLTRFPSGAGWAWTGCWYRRSSRIIAVWSNLWPRINYSSSRHGDVTSACLHVYFAAVSHRAAYTQVWSSSCVVDRYCSRSSCKLTCMESNTNNNSSAYLHGSDQRQRRSETSEEVDLHVEFYLYPTVGTVLIHSVKPELTE